ncbi:hybrid sensor histidine kinase/response regulator, partial [candidate division KSB3 bacterium]
MMTQVWITLIHNALQAMENQGTLIISVIQPEEASSSVSASGSGSGIPKDARE